MITSEHLRIYEQFGGDCDAYARSRLTIRIADHDWRSIEELLQRLRIVLAGLASAEFEERTQRIVADETENEDVCKRLLELAKS